MTKINSQGTIGESHQLAENNELSEITMNDSLLQTNEQILKSFYEIVRTGRHPERAELFMAKEVKAHQINSENMVTIIRSPQNYADHIREMKDSWGNFKIEIEELITQNQKVYVRWKQIGIHIGEYEGYQPTNKEVVELGSAIYRLENQKIVEYWIQVDRLGIIEQLKKNQEAD